MGLVSWLGATRSPLPSSQNGVAAQYKAIFRWVDFLMHKWAKQYSLHFFTLVFGLQFRYLKHPQEKSYRHSKKDISKRVAQDSEYSHGWVVAWDLKKKKHVHLLAYWKILQRHEYTPWVAKSCCSKYSWGICQIPAGRDWIELRHAVSIPKSFVWHFREW